MFVPSFFTFGYFFDLPCEHILEVEGVDFIEITPPADDGWRHAEIDTYDDHRMAMCFSLVALSKVGVTINEPECVAKTFPTYFDVLAGLLK